RMLGLMRAKELIYAGRVLTGQEAVEIGLALKCFPIESLLAETKEFAEMLGEKAPISIQFAKKRLQDATVLDLGTVLDLETDAIVSCMDTEDWHEGTIAFNEKRKPIYKGK
ncbi:enoyl-CoA hydratase/isomerase family protein, partial [Thermodesulfobacteriota bacterium]